MNKFTLTIDSIIKNIRFLTKKKKLKKVTVRKTQFSLIKFN